MQEDSDSLKQKCEELLTFPEIRFAGFLDYMGNLVAGGFKQGVEPLKSDDDRKKMFMEAVLRMRTRQEFDENLGPVDYAGARRKKIVTIAFPVEDKLLFVSAEPDVDIDKTARKIIGTL